MTTEFTKTALLALPGRKAASAEEAGLLSWSRPFLINEIRKHGVDVVVARGIGSLSETDGEAHNVIRPDYSTDGQDVVIHRMGSIGLNEFGVIRNIVRPMIVDTDTPFLNPNNIRQLARDKFAISEHVLQESGVYNRRLVQLENGKSPLEIAETLSTVPGDIVVAKPIGGQRSRGVFVDTKEHLSKSLNAIEEPYLVEEKLDFSMPFPGIRAINETEQARLNYANSNGVNKELRMYYFGNGDWDSVGRIARPGETNFLSDEWLYIDHESIPGTVIDGAERVIRKLCQITGTDEFNIALDWVYASSTSQFEPSWQVMEVNAAEPQLVQLHEHEDVGRRHHQKMAIQIARIALS